MGFVGGFSDFVEHSIAFVGHFYSLVGGFPFVGHSTGFVGGFSDFVGHPSRLLDTSIVWLDTLRFVGHFGSLVGGFPVVGHFMGLVGHFTDFVGRSIALVGHFSELVGHSPDSLNTSTITSNFPPNQLVPFPLSTRSPA